RGRKRRLAQVFAAEAQQREQRAGRLEAPAGLVREQPRQLLGIGSAELTPRDLVEGLRLRTAREGQRQQADEQERVSELQPKARALRASFEDAAQEGDVQRYVERLVARQDREHLARGCVFDAAER